MQSCLKYRTKLCKLQKLLQTKLNLYLFPDPSIVLTFSWILILNGFIHKTLCVLNDLSSLVVSTLVPNHWYVRNFFLVTHIEQKCYHGNYVSNHHGLSNLIIYIDFYLDKYCCPMKLHSKCKTLQCYRTNWESLSIWQWITCYTELSTNNYWQWFASPNLFSLCIIYSRWEVVLQKYAYYQTGCSIDRKVSNKYWITLLQLLYIIQNLQQTILGGYYVWFAMYNKNFTDPGPLPILICTMSANHFVFQEYIIIYHSKMKAAQESSSKKKGTELLWSSTYCGTHF